MCAAPPSTTAAISKNVKPLAPHFLSHMCRTQRGSLTELCDLCYTCKGRQAFHVNVCSLPKKGSTFFRTTLTTPHPPRRADDTTTMCSNLNMHSTNVPLKPPTGMWKCNPYFIPTALPQYVEQVPGSSCLMAHEVTPSSDVFSISGTAESFLLLYLARPCWRP